MVCPEHRSHMAIAAVLEMHVSHDSFAQHPLFSGDFVATADRPGKVH